MVEGPSKGATYSRRRAEDVHKVRLGSGPCQSCTLTINIEGTWTLRNELRTRNYSRSCSHNFQFLVCLVMKTWLRRERWLVLRLKVTF
jgi:hypothetical protein